MKRLIPSLIALFGMLFCVSCYHSPYEPKVIRNAVKDYDGNKYDAVRIGKQTWMKSNLRTTHYADGTPIAAGLGWDVHSPAYSEIPGVDAAAFGLHYNWYAAVRDSNNTSGRIQGICPKGWHLPNAEEWMTLVSNVGGHGGTIGYFDNTAANAMASQAGWKYCPPVNMDSLRHSFDSLALIYDWDWSWEESSEYEMWVHYDYEHCPGTNPANNNSSGFSAMPAGHSSFTPNRIGEEAVFWLPESELSNLAHYVHISYDYPQVSVVNDRDLGYLDAVYGHSIRCVKD